MDTSHLTYIPNVGKDWRQEEKGMTEVVFGWYHWLNGHESEQILRDSEGQGRLAGAAVHSVEKNQTQLSNEQQQPYIQNASISIWNICLEYKYKMYKEMVVKNCFSL